MARPRRMPQRSKLAIPQAGGKTANYVRRFRTAQMAGQYEPPGGLALARARLSRFRPPDAGQLARMARQHAKIRGGVPVPAGALGAAISIARNVLGRARGSAITGPTKVAKLSKEAAGATTTQRPAPRPVPLRPRRRGGAGGTRTY